MRGMIGAGALLGLAAGCGGPRPEDCDPAARFDVFLDADGDGFGAGEAVRACAARRGWSAEDGDCADDDPEVHPDAEERCNGRDDDCDDALDDGLRGRVFFLDADGDGFGDHDDAAVACAAPPARVLDDTDCDDQDPNVSPGVVEVCNDGVDDDCDDLADDADDSLDPDSRTDFFRDRDGDGFGDPDSVRPACAAPEGSADNADDCDDDRAEVNPGADEICNQRDDDCDDLRDHLDDSIDPALLQPGFADADGDGHGDPAAPIDTCGYRDGVAVEDGDDCDDSDPTVNPSSRERTCNAIDDDCDAATPDNPDRDLDGVATCDGDCDDRDALVLPGAPEIPADGVDSDCDGQEDCFGDADGDGLRDEVAAPAGPDPACETAPHLPPSAPIDCDDADPAVDWAGDWVEDLDGDGHGTGPVLVSATCTSPGPGYAPANREADCDESDPATHPGAPDLCGDGADTNCDGTDECRTCAEWLAADPLSPSATYPLRPDGGAREDVYCDMEADGGGWTLVGASVGVGFGLDNYGVTSAFGLGSPRAGTYTGGIWDGLVPAVGPLADLRFVCTLAPGDAPAVDLSFYGVDWYREISAPFGASCFQTPGRGVTPDRRDNLTGLELPASDAYDSGALVGESACAAFADFTVDFDDAGKDSDESDGTDWGNDDYIVKCGTAGAGYAWYVFVRE
jgi:hypothetical protein